jgi:uncharacterized phage protein gp47/JayE
MEFPSFRDLFNTFSAKFKELIPTADPTIKGSWAGAFGKGSAAMAYTLVILAKQVVKQFNPLTATGIFLELWASYDNLTRLDDSVSFGDINVFGPLGTILPSGSIWAGDQSGLNYSSTTSSEIVSQDAGPAITVNSLARSAQIVTAVTNFAHGLSTGDWVKISGANETEYNGSYQVTSFDSITFTYTIIGTPSTPATGTPFSAIPVIALAGLSWEDGIATGVTEADHQFQDGQYVSIANAGFSNYDGVWQVTIVDSTTFTFELVASTANTLIGNINSVHASIFIQGDTTGPETTVAPNGTLTYQGAVLNVEPTAITIEGLLGGADAETDEQLRERMLLSRSTQEGVFTNDQIELAARLINGNTRIFIQNPDSDSLVDADPVLPGQVRVYVIRDNDPLGLVPSGAILQRTKLSIIENGKLPGEMWPDDLFVLVPTLLPVDITMSDVKPNTASMRSALKSQFNAYFTDEGTFGEDLDNDVLRGVAIQTQDLNAGSPIDSFIVGFTWAGVTESVSKDELPVLGVLTINGVVV